MKRTLVYLILCVFVFSLSSSLLAVREYTDKDVTDMIAKAPGKEQLPQAAAIVLLNQRVVKYNSDRSAVSDEHIVVKILQDRGKDTYGDIKRKYNQDSDSVVVVKAVTYLEDGSVMPVEAKAINDLTPADLANASIYSNVMQKVISFPGIAPGVTTELRLRIYSKAPEKNEELFIWGGDLFQSDDPISHKELSVIVPQNLSVRYTFQNEGLDHDSTTENGFTTYTWQVNNSPQIIEEPFMPRMIRIAPRLDLHEFHELGSDRLLVVWPSTIPMSRPVVRLTRKPKI